MAEDPVEGFNIFSLTNVSKDTAKPVESIKYRSGWGSRPIFDLYPTTIEVLTLIHNLKIKCTFLLYLKSYLINLVLYPST